MAAADRDGTRSGTRGLLAFGVILGLGVGLVVLLVGGQAAAKPKFASEFASTYPEAAASQLNGCLLCHDSASPQGEKSINPYGYDFEERGDKDFRRIENLDSDGDGFSNIEEIRALSFPGDPSSTPLTVTTTTTLPGTTPDGASLFASSCASCHGTGGGNLAGTSLSRDQFLGIVTNGAGNSMPAFGASLSSEQIDAIYRYLTGAPTPTTTTLAPGAPIDAGGLFAASCAACHGSDGGNLIPTSLGRPELIGVITNGQGGMPGFASSLSAEQIGALADYLLARSTAPTTTTAQATTPRSGATVYGSSCASCHGPSGGNLVGTALGRPGLVDVITNGQGAMAGFSGRLPAAEIDAVASYLLSLASPTTTTAAGSAPDPGHIWLQNCSICHGIHGDGGPGGALLGLSLDDAAVRTVIVDGAGDMPGFGGELGTAEVDALVDFVLVLSSDGGGEDDADEVGDEVLAAAPPETGTTSATSTTSTTVTSAPSAGSDEAFQAVTAADETDPGRAGSPLVPAIPVVVGALWVLVDGVRGGHLDTSRLFSTSAKR